MTRHGIRRVGAWLVKRRYAVLCSVVFLVICLHTWNGQWKGDFWEHSAVVRELATNLRSPHHPQLPLDLPHSFYSPYAVAIALAARILSLDAVTALSIAGMINLGLLLWALRRFVSSMVPENRDATAFYVLMLTLFWWGTDPWSWSGFFHVGVLPYVLPYPSTFATALALMALATNQSRIETGRQPRFAPVSVITVIVLLSHPVTFIFLATGLVAQACVGRGPAAARFLRVGCLLGTAVVAASFWPYFPLARLLSGDGSAYRAEFGCACRAMYENVVNGAWPALLGVPLAVASAWRYPRRLSWVMLAALSGIYLFGAIRGNCVCGRVLPFVILLLHLAIAERLAALERRAHGVGFAGGLRRLSIPAGVLAAGVLLSLDPLDAALDLARSGRPARQRSYEFLLRHVGQYDVVLADLEDGWLVPTFGGKVVATRRPLAFIDDHDARRKDVDRFFRVDTPAAERERIMAAYGAEYVLLRRTRGPDESELERIFLPRARIEAGNDAFVLLRRGVTTVADDISDRSPTDPR